ncbi:MAG: hypothetical protein IJT05_06555 [Lachnospiraceae bacterium]|nr:hypothetical protein [Lachnospiraceae bacterium]
MEVFYIVNYIKLNPFGEDLEQTERVTVQYLISMLTDKSVVVLSATRVNPAR